MASMYDRIMEVLIKVHDDASSQFDKASDAARDLDVDVAKLDTDVTHLKGAASELADELDEISSSSDGAGTSLRHLSHELRGIVFAAAIALAQDLTTALTALGGELVAVAASATYAAGAIGGVLAGALVQAVPAIGVLVSSFIQVGGVLKAVGAESQAAASAGRDDAAAMESQAAAGDAVAEAKKGIHEAEKGLSEARRQATRDLEDLIAKEKEAELAARRSTLSVKEAQIALEQAVSSGAAPYEVRDAQLALEEAQQAKKQAFTNRGRARVDAQEAREGGVQGMPAMERARDNLAKATERLADAQKQQADTAKDAAQGNSALQQALAGLSGAQRRLYESILRLKDAASDAFKGVNDILLDAFTRSTDKLTNLLGSKRGAGIIGSFEVLAQAQSDSIDEIVDHLVSGPVTNKLRMFTENAAVNMKYVTGAAINLFDTLGNLAEAANPVLTHTLILFERWTEGIADSTSNTERLTKFFEDGLVHLRAWFDFFGSIWDLFMALAGVGGAADVGLKALRESTARIDESTDKVKANASEVRDFFNASHESTKALMGILGSLGREMLEIFDEKRMITMANIISDTLIPALGISIRVVGTLTAAMGAFLSIPVVGTLGTWVIGIGLAGNAISRLTLLIKGLYTSGLLKLVGEGGIFSTLFKDVNRPWMAAGFIAFLIGAAYAIGVLEEKTGFFGDILDKVMSPLDRFSTEVKAAIIIITGFAVALGALRLIGIANGVKSITDSILALRLALISLNMNPLLLLASVVGIAAAAILGFSNSQDEAAHETENLTDKLREQEDAMRRLRDLQLEGEGLELRVKSSRMRVVEAQKALEEAKEEGNKHEINAAKIALSQAKLDLREARLELKDYKETNPKTASGQRIPKRGTDDRDMLEESGIMSGWGQRRTLTPAQIEHRAKMQKNAIEDMMDALDIGKIKTFNEELSEALGARALPSVNKAFRDMGLDITNTTLSSEQLIAAYDILADKQISVRKKEKLLAEMYKDTQGVKNKAKDQIGQLYDQHITLRDALDEAMGKNRDFNSEIEKGGSRKKAITGTKKVAQGFGGLGGAAEAAMTAIKDVVNKGLDEFGAKPLKFDIGGTLDSASGLISKGIDAVGGLFGGLNTGGWVGMPGERGRDAQLRFLGRGEAVLNWQQQRHADEALKRTYGYGLHDMVQKVGGYHAGGANPLGYSGGYAGAKLPGGGRSVAIPGFPGEFINNKVLDEALKIVNKFGVFITDAFATAGHSGPGHLVTGTAIDIVPGSGSNGWAGVNAAVRWAVNNGLTVLYDGQFGSTAYPNHGEGHHAHIELADGVAGGMRGIGRLMQKVPKMKVKSPKGPMGDLLQGAVDKMRKGANKFIGDQQGSLAPGAHGELYSADGDVARIFAQVAKRYKVNKKVALALFEAGLAESGMRDLSYGHSTSTGSLQLLASTAAAMGIDPHDEGAVASAFLTRGYWGKGGAIQINRNDPGLPAHMIAQSVQGSAFMDGSNYLAQKGAALALMARFGLAQGGWPGLQQFASGGEVGSGRAVPVIAHEGEIILNERQQAMLGGKNFLKGMFGFGGASKSHFKDGGEVRGPSGGVRPERGIAWLVRVLNWSEEMEHAFEATSKKLRKMPMKMKGTYDRFADILQRIIGDGGTIDKMLGELDKMRAQFDTKLQRQTYRIHKGEVQKFLNERQLAQRELNFLEDEFKSLKQVRKQLQKTENKVEKRDRRTLNRIKNLRNQRAKTDDKEEKEEIQKQIDKYKKMRKELKGSKTNIEEKIRELNNQIASNIAAQYEATAAIFQEKLSATLPEHQQRVLELKKQIAELSGENFSPDQEALVGFSEKQGELLQNQRKELQAMMKEAKKANNKEEIKALREALLENELAILVNNKELAELNGQIGTPQDFSSTAWKLFRNAVFNGTGGLMPQFQVPSLATGGMITKTGLFELHAGEAVIKSDKAPGDINVEINQAGEVVDPVGMANRLGFIVKTRT